MKTINYYPSDTTIGSLPFSNYISEEIRCLSVKEFTSSQAIDHLGALVSDSPYDLALGSFDKKMIANEKNKIEINDESIDNVDDQEEVLIKMMSRQMYLTPLDLLKHLEKISTNEREVLAISPVLPSKFRLNRSSSLINRLRGTTNEQKA
ncbi:unnamed protein product [Rotaria sordida]|uniref:Uncharacterized protein n=1 Tax=Rotaria sordida TaxID=392033 RepID=A0A815LUQ4_9BILA|nr:unnamed protein product [Rotaria sordida]